MEPKECLYQDQFGYCWLEGEQWLFQVARPEGDTTGEPLKVRLADLVFHHDEDEELH